ncbi:hypothetical protein DFH06DRAFT_1336630 [Mycena polygramma]|nr:hypothetical protein DFH06DRAFT_1340325 [Mycena polygramma]KAJ7635616.1 hypothetical protein DFH06DRAFT_1336630 [Mycena polygramma]
MPFNGKSAAELFDLCVQDRGVAASVRQYLSRDEVATEDVVCPALHRLPIEVLANILGTLPFIDRISFSRTSRNSKAIFDRVMVYLLRVRVRAFGLDFAAINLLQAAVGCVIGGPFLTEFFQSCKVDKQKDIYVYCAQGHGYQVTQYIKNTSEMELCAFSADHGRLNGTRGMWWMCRTRLGSDQPAVVVLESFSTDARDPVFFASCSLMYCLWTDKQLWHGYPNLTLLGRQATTTPAQLRFGTGLSSPVTLRYRLEPYHNAGFHFTDELQQYHVCGSSFNCPSTLRNSSDAGCLIIPLPQTFVLSSVQHINPVSWTMGGQGCSSGTIDGLSRHRKATATSQQDWLTNLSAAIGGPRPAL